MITLEYDDKNRTITLNTYIEDGFLTSSLDIIDEAVTLVIENSMTITTSIVTGKL